MIISLKAFFKDSKKGGQNMSANVAIGVQGFSTLIVYVDKTSFLKEWWDSGDSTALHLKERQC
jgi:hypothetical protein